MKKVIISGASGFIGQALAEALLADGVEVYGLCATPEKLGELKKNPHFHLIQIEFQEYEQLAQKVSERDFDVFFHFAWQGYGKATNDYRVQISNIKYTCDAAYGAIELRCKRFVFADSSHEYLKCPNTNGVVKECSVYGSAKKSARQISQVILHRNGVEFVGVLFTNIFGVGDRSGRSTNTMLKQLMRGQDLDLIKGDHLYDWTYIDDCVGGIIAAAKRGRNYKVYYVGSRQLRLFREIITEVRDVVCPKSKLNFGMYQDNSWIDYQDIDTYALYNDTGYLPSAIFEDSIKKTVDWLRRTQD